MRGRSLIYFSKLLKNQYLKRNGGVPSGFEPRIKVLQTSAKLPGRCGARLSGIELAVHRVFGKRESLDLHTLDRLARVSPMRRCPIALPPASTEPASLYATSARMAQPAY